MPRTMKSKSYNKCFEKRREHGCSRVHRIKLTKVFSNSNYGRINNNSHTTNCNSCDDSDNCMELLTERLARIETLVNNLYKLTQEGLHNSKKNQNRTLCNIDLTSCKLEDLQKLVNFTTNAMSPPSSSQPSPSPKSIHQEKIHSENYSRTKNFTKREEILKYDSQDSGYISDDDVDLKPSSPVTSSKGNIDTLEGENYIHAI
ncbi:15310_t:CDS:2 [Funneliformis mosseae]|uniref:15310_t:CDS:1 n=1 Tax=Funneliformis mosseae TaxID=27381 RepID=A0A9N8WLP5_FUNMO|nr:15310_t:CDS:2 [Funneliformis mosseae]